MCSIYSTVSRLLQTHPAIMNAHANEDQPAGFSLAIFTNAVSRIKQWLASPLPFTVIMVLP